ncbi:TRAP transporter small permease subunit [Vreelandella venusta]|jgi:TRAP-type C4-dicarboxylate transport system permease small subunit|uniref:TRAP transporter small permease subunit n=1 Tax=Vreelandella venusta TaxID=44935 RepID=UPI003C2E4BBE
MIFKLVDKISEVSAWVSKLAIVVLVLSMLYEVIARYVFNSSTIWAFDISYMATGVAFVLGVAWTAQIDGHIKVDVLSSLLPNNVYRLIVGVVYTVVLFPTFLFMAWYGWKKTVSAFITNEVEMVSTWAPQMWPFYTCIAVGLTLLALQFLVIGLRSFLNKTIKSEIE